MEVFGMTSSPVAERSFDYLKEATSKKGGKQNESISFLLDASAIAASTGDATDSVHTGGGGGGEAGSLASTKELKQAFYTLHDTAVSEFLSSPKRNGNSNMNNNMNGNTRRQSKLYSPKAGAAGAAAKAAREAERSLSPFSLPSLSASKQKENQNRTKAQTRNSPATVPSRPKINTRRSLSTASNSNNNTINNTNINNTHKGVTTTTLKTPGSARGGKPVPQTPGGFWTTNTESKTFVNGLLSPFSPLLHSAIHKTGPRNANAAMGSDLATIHSLDPEDANPHQTQQPHPQHQTPTQQQLLSVNQQLKLQREEYLQYVSLQPCRKVSVVVRVSAVDETDQDAKRCIFPHYKDNLLPSGGSLSTLSPSKNQFTTPPGKTANNNLLGISPTSMLSSTPNSKSSNKLSSPTHRRDVVVVNPTAFGKYIPSQVTMETAKLVAQVANIDSEDWARLYEFHHVMWPTPTKSRETAQTTPNKAPGTPKGSPTTPHEDLASSYNTMDSLSRAVVQDLLVEHNSSLLISLGHEPSCFGTSSNSSIGLWPKIMNQCAAMLEAKGVVRLTMVEILEPSGGGHKNNTPSKQNSDSFRDLLAPSDQKPTSIYLRHPDMKGAILEGLTEVEIDSMPALLEALAKSRQRRAQRRKAKGNRGGAAAAGMATATAVIGTLKYWEHAVSHKLDKPPNASVTCVELASHHSSSKTASAEETLESIAHRKSAVSLGQALRQLLLQQAQGHEQALGVPANELAPVISYRETTLTKVLQRSMESSKIVLVASISPLSRDYDHSVFTLNYLRRLLVKPGNTLTSPFGSKTSNSHHNRTTPKTAKTDNRSHPIDNTNNNNSSHNTSVINRSILSSPEALESQEKLKDMAKKDPNLLERLISDPRQRLAKLFGPSPTRRKKPWDNVLGRMEELQKSTRVGAIRMSSPSPTGSNSAPNSYAGPEEARQVVESPGSAQQQGQPRQSWQADEDDENDGGGMGEYQIPFDENGNPQGANEEDEDSNEWASEEEIERELLASARRKERSLQTQIEDMERDLYPQENFSYEEEEEGKHGDGHEEEAIEEDLQGDHPPAQEGNYVTEIAGNIDGQSLNEIVPEGSYYDDEEEQVEDLGIPEAPTDLSNMIQQHLDESFAPDTEEENQYDGDETLGLQPIAVETVADTESLSQVEDHRQPIFTGEEWQVTNDDDGTSNNNPAHEGSTQASSLGLIPDQNDFRSQTETPPVASSPAFTTADDSTENNPLNQTNYDLPDDPLPARDSADRIHVRSSSPVPTDRSGRPPASPYRERQAFNSYASPYSVTIKTSKSREYTELTNEREELRNTVSQLQKDLQKVSEDRDTNVEQYEHQIQQLYAKLDEAYEAKRELETVASQAITARTTSEQEVERFEDEREELQKTVDALRNDLARMSESHENQLYRHRAEIDDFQSKLDRARETQKEIEDIADDAVTAHKTQVEETRMLAAEREELQVTIETLQNTMHSLEKDQGGHVSKYQQEIRQLHARLEETMKDKRSLQQEADDARFQLETQSEKLRVLNREREDLHSTLNSVKGSAQKALGDHDEYLRRFKTEIQELRTKLDDAHSEKLKAETAADEIRFAKDDLERRVTGLEEELASSRANTLRLEGIRREEQDTIRKMNAELRRQDSEKMNMEHFRSELERLKRQKDHLESLVAHRKVESSASLKEIEEELARAKRKNLQLEEELAAVRMELVASQKYNRELAEKLREAYEENSLLSRQLSERDESLKRLQSNFDELQSQHDSSRDVIARLNDDLRNRESAAMDIEQLHQKLSRMRQDRDYLQDMMESRKAEYERSMDEKNNEVSAYASQIETLKMDLENVTNVDKRYRTDAEEQLRSLQASEANLIRNLRQRDAKIDQLQDDMQTQKAEITSLREREASSSHAENEVIRLQDRLTKLEIALDVTTKEREEAEKKAKTESRSHKSLLNELKQSRDEAHRYKNAMKDLNDELNERQEETLKAKERIFQMESTLRAFKNEAKERVSNLVDRENDRTRTENRNLATNLQEMNGMVKRLRRERDICFQSLKDGQKRLSELSSRKDSLVPVEDLLATPGNQRRSISPKRNRESRPATRSYRPPVESITARASSRTRPEIFITSYQLGSPTTLAEERAEEIAACVALNAKESLEENFEEVSQLRSKIYRLEDERSEQVSSLKAKMRNLERELSYERVESDQVSSLRAKVRNLEKELSYERVGNRTPVMGSARRSRKQNHFMDWDERHWDEKHAY